MYDKRAYNIHKLLRAIDKNTLLSKLTATDIASSNDRFISADTLFEAFAEFPEIIAQTEAVLQSCDVHFNLEDKEPNQNLKVFGTNEIEDFKRLKQLAYDGIVTRKMEHNQSLEQRLETELSLIKQKGFVSLFFNQLGYCHVCTA